MARPQKNNCDYFPHDNNMRNHVKVRAIRNKFVNGYAVWSMILEFLTGSDGNTFENSPLQMELLSGDFGVSVAEISDIINYCLKLEILFEKDGWIYSDSLNERLAPVYEKRGKSKQLSAKQKRLNGKFTSNNTEQTVVSATEIPQSKVNKIKEKEIEIEDNNSEKTPEKFNFKKSLILIGVDEKILKDWMIVRKLKKCANTETAFIKIKNQIAQSGIDANECIKIAVERSWGGFEAEWLINLKSKNNINNAKDRRNLSEINHSTATKLADM